MAYEKVQVVTGSAEVAANGTAVALESTKSPATLVRSVIITAGIDNATGEHIVVGDSNVVGALATRRGHPLAPGEDITINGLNADQRGTRGISGGQLVELTEIYVDCITNDDRVSYLAYR